MTSKTKIKEVTKKEIQILDKFEKINDCTADIFNYDNEYIDIEVTYQDDTNDQLKLNRISLEIE